MTFRPFDCVYCSDGYLVRRTGKYGEFFGCSNFPQCTSVDDVRYDGLPSGMQSDQQTRQARREAHNAFDEIWKREYMSRSDAYSWLAEGLGLGSGECHIKRLTRHQCEIVVRISEAFLEERS